MANDFKIYMILKMFTKGKRRNTETVLSSSDILTVYKGVIIQIA